MRDDRLRVFLIVVGRQPVVFISDESLKEAPRAARDTARLQHFLFRENRTL